MLNTAIEQFSTTTGTGTMQLIASSDPLRRSFVAAIGSGQRVFYRAELGSAWEEGWGIATAGTPDTLTRNVIASSAANALVNWTAGTKRVFCAALPDAARFGAMGALPTAGGTAQALTLSYAPAARVLLAGMRFTFLANTPNTAVDPTLSVNGLAAAPIKGGDGGLLWPGALRGLCDVVFDGTNFRLADPAPGGLGVETTGSVTTTSGSIVAVTLANPGTSDQIAAWASGAPTRLTMRATGRVVVSGTLQWGSSVSSARIIQIRRSGVTVASASLGGQTATVEQSITHVFPVAAGDFVELAGFQDSASNLSATARLSLSVLG